MADRRGAGRTRREPVFDSRADRSALDVSLSRADRVGSGGPSRPATPSRRKPSGSRKPARKGPRRSIIGRLVYYAFVLCLWGAIGLAGLLAYYASQLPPIDQLSVPKRPPNIAILASDGSLLANRGETGGRTISIKELPPYLPRAFVAIEDRRFYQHFGVDPVGIIRALARNITRRGVSQGGSTLTQQLAKNLFLTQERTASRKIQEAILALWLEHKYTKDQILELYLNRVYFGAGAYGVEAAAQRYYGKSAREVTLAEAAVLGGLVQAPSRLAPNRNPDAARARAAMVLAAMQELGFISQNDMKLALANPARPSHKAGSGSANYVADLVMDQLDDYVGTIEADISVATTVDPKLQALAERALGEELNQHGAKLGVGQGALVSMRPDGAVRALIGGRDYTESQFNRATTAKRQPGSSFKAFVYLAAMERGLTPATMREDSPINIKGWTPGNYSGGYKGPVTLREAFAHSLNTVAVRVGLEVGPKAVVQTAQRLGITSPLQANASIALGTSEVSPLELVGAYAAFANGGTGVVPYVITSVKSGDGKVMYQRQGGGLGRVIDPTAVSEMDELMRAVVTSGTARKADLPGWEVAGKTGTSQDWRDAWFVGFTGTLVTGVWVGNDDGTPTKKVSGGHMPVDIWAAYMKPALAGTQPVPLPGFDNPRPAAEAAPQVASNRTGSIGRAAPAPAGDPLDGVGKFLSGLFGR